jgi:DNA-binding GntR family transcriptional regulator
MATGAELAQLQIQSTADRVRGELRRLILSGALEPGQPLNEKLVAEQLGVSRSPVREALQRLVTERLLTAERNKSVTVRQFTADDINEIYDARTAIESHAAATVITAGPQRVADTCEQLRGALQQLHTALETGDRLEVAEADLGFHQQLVRCGGNSRLVDAYLLLSAETITCMTWLENLLPSGDELLQDHQDFIDALNTHDPGQMCRVIAQHLDRASANLSAYTPPGRPNGNPARAPQR